MTASACQADTQSPGHLAPPTTSAAASTRLASVDAYRGLVMLLMMGEVLEFASISEAVPGNSFWKFLAHHQTHVAWIGCSLHDLIQPSFSFLVGVALPFSLSRRMALGQPAWQRTLHAFWRAAVLVLLGVFLRSIGQPQTYWTFEDTLTQIGLGYGLLYLVGLRSLRVQWAVFATIVVGYWLAFALYPLPSAAFDWASAGSARNGVLPLTGFAAHWSMNANLAWAFDTWFLNLFPRQQAFTGNAGGYCTLSFVPTLATMILGLLAGGVLRSTRSPLVKVRWLAVAGVIGLVSGWALGMAGVCPVVKRIWTPSWVIFSGGWCFLLLGAFFLMLDVFHRRGWACPLIIVGMNSIAAYLVAHLFEDFIQAALKRHLGADVISIAGIEYQPLVLGLGVLLCEWLLLWWMYRRKIFLRV